MDGDLILKILGALGVTAIVSSGFTTFVRFILRDWTGDIDTLNTKFEEASKLATSIRELAGNSPDGVDIAAVADRIQKQALTRLVRRLELSDPEYTKAMYPLQGPLGVLLLVASPMFFTPPDPSPGVGRLFAATGIVLTIWFAIAGLRRRRKVDSRVSEAVEAIMPVIRQANASAGSSNTADNATHDAEHPKKAIQDSAVKQDSAP